MNKTGLCSVTFRNLSAEAVIDCANHAGLNGIEWGGDVHVPLNSHKRAKEVGKITREAGLDVIAYGSYYRVGIENEAPFEEILKTAVLLSAPAIRVWAGRKGSDLADESYREQVVKDTKRISELAQKENIDICFEYHRKTLTDTPESAVQLMEDVSCPNVYLYWQPSIGTKTKKRVANIKKIKPWLAYIHVFYWKEEIERYPLVDGKNEWKEYIEAINQENTGKFRDRYFMLEFVKDDEKQQFYEDAAILKKLLEEKI
ncbi:sugar phosphate isomerase/epimerase [Carnobacterium sp. CS13]|uniref:sugar phosphate isomerase/epimerase family protein n=1 Tax=Carnobacterium sp. CS13 TaxID=2800128 RepID=UPI001912C09C|nr:TIM barrel protein [Carnobacterium sp. CS13]QQP70010.1 sugar phosphate isomerase/epimerase [Carnobacterium sp. CS13]